MVAEVQQAKRIIQVTAGNETWSTMEVYLQSMLHAMQWRLGVLRFRTKVGVDNI